MDSNLVIVHTNADGFVDVHFQGDVTVLLVDERAPDDLVYQLTCPSIPQKTLDLIACQTIGHAGDGSAAEIRALRALAETEGHAHLNLVGDAPEGGDA